MCPTINNNISKWFVPGGANKNIESLGILIYYLSTHRKILFPLSHAFLPVNHSIFFHYLLQLSLNCIHLNTSLLLTKYQFLYFYETLPNIKLFLKRFVFFFFIVLLFVVTKLGINSTFFESQPDSITKLFKSLVFVIIKSQLT